MDTASVDGYFDHEGHRTVVSQRALQVHTDPLLGYTELDGVGYVVAEVSPYEFDLDWGEINEPDEMAPRGAAPRPRHREGALRLDEDSDQDLVDFQTEEAIAAVVEGRRKEFVADLDRLRASTTPRGRARTTRCSSTRSARARSAGSARAARTARRAARRMTGR